MKYKCKFYLFLSLFLFLLASCRTEIASSNDPILSFDKENLSLNIGNVDFVNLSVSENQNTSVISWEYDSNIVDVTYDNYGAVITAINPGKTTVKAKCGVNSATCYVNISEEHYSYKIENPYVYASTDFVSVEPAETVRISASLYGGTSSDVNGYSWTIDKPNVASITTEGNYCWITGISKGLAKLTIRHSKSSYGYSVLINCSVDGEVFTYITTDDDIITVNLDDMTDNSVLEVDLVNPSQTDYLSQFTYTIVDSSGNELSDPPCTITPSSNRCIISPHAAGNCYIKVSHPLSSYDSTILVRILENPDLSYVSASSTNVILDDIERQTVIFKVEGCSSFDYNLFDYSFDNNAASILEYTIGGSNSENTGHLTLKGLKTGSTKVTVSYPDAASVSVLIIVRELSATVVSATTYISTLQNYVSMHVGDSPVSVGISLSNSYINAENELVWSCVSTAADGSSDPVVSCRKSTGTWVSSSSVSARSVVASYTASGYVILAPEKEGSATITVTHPNAKYPCSIVVTVLPAENTSNAEADTYIRPVSDVFTTLITSDTKDIDGTVIKSAQNTVTLSISTENLDNSKLVWSCSSPDVSVVPSGDNLSAFITVDKESSGFASVIVSHPDCRYSITFTLKYNLTAFLNSQTKLIYINNPYYNLKTNQTETLTLNTENIEETDVINWTCSNNNLLEINQLSKSQVSITAKKEGNVTVTASSEYGSAVFYINIKSDVLVDETADSYLSTFQNVVYLEKDKTETIEIMPYNISERYWNQIKWEIDNTSDYAFVCNNNYATIQALTDEAVAKITVSHPNSPTNLTIYVQTGNEKTFAESVDFCFVSTDSDVIELKAGQEQKQILCYLNHTVSNQTETAGFTAILENPEIASVSTVTDTNVLYITPLKEGKTTLSISHPKANYPKEIIILVNKADDFSVCPYISTNQNIVTVLKDSVESVSVSLVNCEDYDANNWSWYSSDTRIADVVSNNGNSAFVSGLRPGTTKIKVSHKKCEYSLTIVIIVIDSKIASSNPYISTNTNIVHLNKGEKFQIVSKMIGGDNDSDMYFSWNCANSSVCMLDSSGSAANVTALNKGSTYVTIKNTKYVDAYTKSVLIIVDDIEDSECYISVSQKIIKINPNDNSLVTVSASLVNGSDVDAQDFVWWSDDPQIASVDSVAGNCKVNSTGVSGSTKIHVKHPKVSKTIDIVVLVSSYDSFAFSERSKTIKIGQCYFIPMEVPATENKATVRYSSSNEDVCVVCGTNNVAMVSGAKIPGTASITAELIVDDNVIATSSMLICADFMLIDDVSVNIAKYTIDLTVGDSYTLTATLSGADNDNEKHKIYWTKKDVNTQNCCSVFTDDNGNATGHSILITAERPGECIFTAHYGNATKDVHMIINAQKEVSISLDSSYMDIDMEDGSKELCVTLKNSNDYSSILWSASKVGGKNVVKLSFSGNKCLVFPRNPGTTIVTAQLPDGKKAQCMVYVKEPVKIEFQFSNVYVMPGYTVEVPYTLVPESAQLMWLNEFSNMNSSSFGTNVEYYSYEIDEVNHIVYITGKQDTGTSISGTLKPYLISGMSSTNPPSLNIYVGYNNLIFEVTKHDITSSLPMAKPDNKLPTVSTEIRCFPAECDLIFDNDNEFYSVASVEKIQYDMEDRLTYKIVTLNITPKKEFLNKTLQVQAVLSDHPEILLGNDTIKLNAYYEAYDDAILLDYDFGTTGGFTYFSQAKNGVELGDGESFTFEVYCANPQINISFSDARFVSNYNSLNTPFPLNSHDFNINSNKTDYVKDLNVNNYGEYIKLEDFNIICQNFNESNELWKDSDRLLRQSGENALSLIKNNISNSTNRVSYTFRHLFDYSFRLPDLNSLREKPKDFLEFLKLCTQNNVYWIKVDKEYALKYKDKYYSAINHPYSYNNPDYISIFNGIRSSNNLFTPFEYSKWTDPNLNQYFLKDNRDTIETNYDREIGRYNYSEWGSNWTVSDSRTEKEPGQSLRSCISGNFKHGNERGYYKRLAVSIKPKRYSIFDPVLQVFPKYYTYPKPIYETVANTKVLGQRSFIFNCSTYYELKEFNSESEIEDGFDIIERLPSGKNLLGYNLDGVFHNLDDEYSFVPYGNNINLPCNVNYGLFVGNFILKRDSELVVDSVNTDNSDHTKSINSITYNDFDILKSEKDWNDRFYRYDSSKDKDPYDSTLAYGEAIKGEYPNWAHSTNGGRPVVFPDGKKLEYYFNINREPRNGGPDYYWYTIITYKDYYTPYCYNQYLDIEREYYDTGYSYLMKWEDFETCPLFYQEEVSTMTTIIDPGQMFKDNTVNNYSFTVEPHLLFDPKYLSIYGTVDDSPIGTPSVPIGSINIGYSTLKQSNKVNNKNISIFLTARACPAGTNLNWKKVDRVEDLDGNYRTRYYLKN